MPLKKIPDFLKKINHFFPKRILTLADREAFDNFLSKAGIFSGRFSETLFGQRRSESA
jgi:phosphopantetheinyl transferase (holo-ACP synthase)